MRSTLIILAILVLAQTAAAQATRPATLNQEALTLAIRQRDSAEQRQAAIAQVHQMLAAGPTQQVAALTVLVQVADIRFDRTAVEPATAALLRSPNADVRRCALTALPGVTKAVDRIDEVAALAADPDAGVRAAVMPAVVQIRRTAGVETPVVEPALSLLGDKDEAVVTATARSLWSVPLGEEAEAKVIDLSRFDDNRLPNSDSVQYTMNYYVLSTRPTLSRGVAQRLAEIARHPRLGQEWRSRAIWGLNRPSAGDATDLVTRALIEELDHTLTRYNREWAVRGLATAATPAAIKKLQEVAVGDDSQELRQLATRLLE